MATVNRGSFGWLVGIQASPYLSDADYATFSCVLGMPWASKVDHYDPSNIPDIPQKECEQVFSEWLTPWAMISENVGDNDLQQNRIGWQLMVKSANDDNAPWEPIPIVDTNDAYRLKIVPDMQEDISAQLVNLAAKRLHAHVKDHKSAMSLAEGGLDGKSYSYPIISPGLTQLPAPLSDALLGTSAVIKVRWDLVKDKLVAALPVFRFVGNEIKPNGTARKHNSEPPQYEFAYQGANTRKIDDTEFSFSGCVVQCISIPDSNKEGGMKPGKVTVRCQAPDGQIYAEISRRFWPLKLWLDSIDISQYKPNDFCRTFTQLLGCGEDEMASGDDGRTASGSIYELVLDHQDYESLFGAKSYNNRIDKAKEMHKRFADFSMENSTGLLNAFKERLNELALLTEGTAVAELLASLAQNHINIVRSLQPSLQKMMKMMSEPGQSAHAIWAAWLAAVLPNVVDPDKKDMAENVADKLIQRTKVAMRRADSNLDPVLDDDVLRLMDGQIDYCDEFWEKIHSSMTITEALSELCLNKSGMSNEYCKMILKRVNPNTSNDAPQNSSDEALEKVCNDSIKVIQNLLNADTPLAEDLPLQLRYAQNETQIQESEIRGYILALQMGLCNDTGEVDWKDKPCAWLSTFLGKLPDADQTPIKNKDNDDSTLFLDTQGATQSDGLIEQVCTYDGSPLFAAEAVPTDNGGQTLPEMFVRVPTEDGLPPLAYSAYYRALSGTVDNAGVILESGLRRQKYVGLPLEANKIEGWGEKFQYLSRQPPGLPSFGPVEDYGVAEDTLSFHLLKDSQRHNFRVAVLYGGENYIEPKSTQTITLYAPTASASFVRRWLAADQLLPSNDRWDPVKNSASGDIENLQKSAHGFSIDGQPFKGVPHPAVSGIELTVRWCSLDKMEVKRSETWHLDHLSDNGWQFGLSTKVELERVESDKRKLEIIAQAGHFHVTVPKGEHAVLEARSILNKKYLDGAFARFRKAALVGEKDPGSRPYVYEDDKYKSREAVRLYIESLPDVPADAATKGLEFTAKVVIRTPDTVEAPQELNLMLSQGDHHAQWVKGLKIEPRRWQWSGYPVQFPLDDALEQWLPLYAGTNDAMPRPETVARFTTKKDDDKRAWLLDKLVMQPFGLVTPRPATHIGMIVTPVPRFESLLSAEVKSKIKPIFVYTRVPGVSPRTRLPPPVWQEAIPLPHTFALSGTDEVQVSPGNLLVLGDPAYDCSDTAAFGGIAERIELDVVSTWTKDTGEQRIDEIGPNPIFHGSPSAKGGDTTQPALTLGPLFGLGYDRVVGGRPAQTGVVVRPEYEDESTGKGGRWLLAKCRLRRFIVPKLILDSKIKIDESNKGQLKSNKGQLKTRRVEDGWIPEDFVVYATNKPLSSLRIECSSNTNYAFKLPKADSGHDLIYLITWHRDRWAGADATWRPLVHLYECNWKFRAKVPPYEQSDYPLADTGVTPVSFELETTGPNVEVYRVDASDYTESRWLNFIGSFGQGKVTPVNDFILKRQADGTNKTIGFELSLKNPSGKMPILNKYQSLCPTLLLLFNPQRDLMRGRIADDGGELVEVYATSNGSETTPVVFDKELLKVKKNVVDPDLGQRAVLMSLQLRNLKQDSVTLPNSWEDLVESLFPRENQIKESTMRLVPEYIGPFRVDASEPEA